MVPTKKNRYIAFFCVTILLSAHMLYGAASSSETAFGSVKTDDTTPTHTLLMFLDDSEMNMIGAISSNFLTAFTQKAAPILVSASLIDNIRTAKPLEEKDPARLQQIAKEIDKKDEDEHTPEEEEMLKSIILSVIDIDKLIKEAWIIKEINPSLYLLLPKKFLQKKGLSGQDVEAYITQNAFTQAEQALGLKVNHLKTVELTSIQKPEGPSFYVDYLVPYLENIFLTRKEYRNIQNKANGPNWVIYINGHGSTETAIAGLSIEDFKKFLGFLENIPTKLFMYSTCYAGGKNIEILYKDAMTGVDKTYDFPIISDALTDSYTYSTDIKIKLKEGKLDFETNFDFNCFVRQVEAAGILDYDAAAKCITSEKTDINATAQIRFPGLPWFSILDTNRVVSIGSVFAKTHTAPLNIARFFAKKGTLAKPEGLLLYAYDIPFELIIDTKKMKRIGKKKQKLKAEQCYVPTFVSMISKDAVHHLKKISSTCNTSDNILNGFYIEGLYLSKTFIIDEVSAPFSEITGKLLTNGSQTSGTLTNVIVDVTQEEAKKYFTYDGQVYFTKGSIKKNPFALATDEQKNIYNELLAEHNSTSSLEQTNTSHVDVTPELMQQIKEEALQAFAQPIDYTTAEQAITSLLERMPNNTALHIPTITGTSCPSDDEGCWQNFFNHLTMYRPKKTHKLIWFDELRMKIVNNFDENGHPMYFEYPLYKDLIIEITPKEARAFYTWQEETEAGPPIKYRIKGSRNIAATTSEYLEDYPSEDYTPAYADLLAYFDEHFTLEKPKQKPIIKQKPIRKQLTPERIAQIKVMLERKISKP